MLKRRVTPELWQTLLQELRDNPDMDRDRIALAHGVEPACLESWYQTGVEETEGYDTKDFVGGGAPLKTLVFMSQVKARAASVEDYSPPSELVKGFGGAERKAPRAKTTRTTKYKLAAAWDAAREDAIESLALKGKSARAARNNAAALLGITGQMLALAKPALRRLEEEMNDPAFLKGMSAYDVVKLYASLGRMSKDVMECAKMADEIEAAILGDPNALAEADPIDTVSDQDALAVIEAASQAAALAREGGLHGMAVGYTGAADDDEN